jgi:hypothetical protein
MRLASVVLLVAEFCTAEGCTKSGALLARDLLQCSIILKNARLLTKM